ncbi:MAG TPA: class I SAM-dependent methyltransferase [Burkholderiales bacterium]|nr:class I SAM-dependent methyltransferase [Burkholderiales bacterium]
MLQWIESYAAELEAIGAEPPPAPRWNQDWFPRLDAAAAYATVRTVKPRRIVEVGSGHSTRFLARAVVDGGLDTRITAIDPKPRASLAGLDIEWIATPVQRVAAFPALGEGDILFIDSSHQLKPGSDVDFLFNAVLPLLPQGVRVHFHDIFLPDDYPEYWAWRRYNEQPAVAALIENDVLRVNFASHATVKFAREKIRGVLGRLPLLPGAIESSLWLTRN